MTVQKFLFFQCGDCLLTSESDSKVNPSANGFNMLYSSILKLVVNIDAYVIN